MSLLTDARGYAEIAVEQGKNLVTGAVANATGPATTLAAKAQDRGAGLAELARKPAYAVLGAGEVALAAISKRVETLPAEAEKFADATKDNLDEVQGKAQALAASGQEQVRGHLRSAVTELRERGEKAVHEVRAFTPAEGVQTARSTFEAYAFQAKSLFDAFADRGEQVAASLRQDPRVVKVIGLVDRAVARAPRPDVAAPVHRAATAAGQPATATTAKAAKPTTAKAAKPTTAKPTTAATARAAKPTTRTAAKAPVKRAAKAPVKRATTSAGPRTKA